MNSSTKQRASSLCLLVSLAMAAGVGWAETAASVQDPVVADVVQMLQAGVDEGVILQWLESTDRQPADVSSQGIIALTEAGATQDLISVLLERVAEREVDVAADEPAPAPAPETSETIAPRPTSRDLPESAEGRVEVLTRLRAKRLWVDEDEPDRPREERWDVFLYLDGEFVAWTRATLQGEPVQARRVVRAGRHEVRVVLQRYEKEGGDWLYESLSVPTPIAFEAELGEPIEVEVEIKRVWGLWRQRTDGGPLSYLIRQGDRVLAGHSGTGGDPNRWSPVCEDVEANFADADSVPARFRDPMSRCIRWVDLWTGAGRSSSRNAILAELASYDFEPPVR